jgi:hypothetical protein
MRKFAHQIQRLPVIGDLVSYAVYWFCLVLCYVFAALAYGQRLKFGTSLFLIPKGKAQVVRDGIELLRGRDSEMFSRLTSSQQLVIYYFEGKKFDRTSSHRLFFMHSKFVDMGPEGVACFTVQSLMVAAAAPRVNQHRLDEREEAALKSVSRNMAEWLSKHSFNPVLINAYKKVVERQEQREGAAYITFKPLPLDTPEFLKYNRKHEDGD